MTLLRLSSIALSRSRFALSPLAETVGSAIVLSKPCAAWWLAPWHQRHSGDFAAMLDADPFVRGLVTLLGSTKWLPGFVAIPPTRGMHTTIADELGTVAATGDGDVRAELDLAVAHSWKDHDLAWARGDGLGAKAADVLQRVWTHHVSVEWARRRALLERDVTYRAGQLAAHGWPRALEQMGYGSSWVGADAIQFSDTPGPDHIVGEGGMLFVPVSVTSGSWLCDAPPDRYALVYPARGAASARRTETDQALERLVGAGRAAILKELERPATSTELVAQLNLSLGTVGGHLSVLRDAGLILGTRVGRRVVYARTRAGDTLAEAPGS